MAIDILYNLIQFARRVFAITCQKSLFIYYKNTDTWFATKELKFAMDNASNKIDIDSLHDSIAVYYKIRH